MGARTHVRAPIVLPEELRCTGRSSPGGLERHVRSTGNQASHVRVWPGSGELADPASAGLRILDIA